MPSRTASCAHCGTEFTRVNKRLNQTARNKQNIYCSMQCQYAHRTAETVAVSCTNCGTELLRKPYQLSKNNFCSRSCSATWRNSNKTYGTRRSKLEVFLEDQIREHFPDLQLLPNDKTAVQYELDLYLPQLKLAIELNGPTHYNPIYGTEKLESILQRDEQKTLACKSAGITLHIVDVSKVYRLTKAIKQFHWELIREFITTALHNTGTPGEN